MNLEYQNQTALNLYRQRNCLLVICFLSTLGTVGLTADRLINGSKMTLMPSAIAKSVTLRQNGFDPSLIKKHSIDVLMTALNTTPENADFMHNLVVEMALPQHRGKLKNTLTPRFNAIKRMKMSTRFSPHEAQVDHKHLSAVIEGKYTIYVGAKEVESSTRRYLVGVLWKNRQI